MSRMWLACSSEKSKGALIKRRARGRTVVGSADRRDDLVEHVDGLQEALDDVGARLGLAQTELRASGDDLDLVGDVVRERLGQVQACAARRRRAPAC